MEEKAQAGAESATDAVAGFVWTRSHVIALAVLCLAPLLDHIDITVVNVALPTIEKDLGFSQADLQWVVNAYTVLFGGFLLLGGRAGDLLGRRRVFLAGVVAFTAASLASGLAQDEGVLIATRAVQGLAAAFVVPMTLAMIAAAFPEGKPRNLALAAWGTTTAMSASLGLIVGGVLVTGPGWRWIFFVNLPVGLFILLAAWRYVSADRPSRRHRRFDAIGAVTSTGGVSLLAYAVVQTSAHAWGSTRTIGLLAGAAALIGYFVVHEAVFASEPLVPLSLFKNRTLTGANVVSALSGAALIATFYFATLYQQQVLHYSALRTGLAYLPLTGMLVVAAGLGPALIPKVGIRWVTALGSLVATAGLVLFTRLSPTDDLVGDIILPSVIIGAGLAFLFIPMTIAAVHGVDPARTGVASALVNVTRTVGGALGLAIVATIATDRATSLARAGNSAGVALSGGFRLGFAITAALMGVTALAAIAVFRAEGRGQKVDLAEVTRAGIET